MAVATTLLGVVLITGSTLLTEAPNQRFMKIELCTASGRTYDDCTASTSLTAWDRAYDALFH